jgi:hypothetical protein
MLAQIAQGSAIRKLAGDCVSDGGRQEDLSPMGSGHKPRGTVNGRAIVIAFPLLRLTLMQAHTHPQRTSFRPIFSEQALLGVDTGSYAIYRIGKYGMKAITGGLDHLASGCCHGRTQQFIVARQGGLHRCGKLLPETRAAFQIGEEKRPYRG